MDGRPTWTDCDEAGDYVVPNVLSPRNLVSRPDNMDETVPHSQNSECIMFLPDRIVFSDFMLTFSSIKMLFRRKIPRIIDRYM